jgi:hypothetical protein
MADTQNTEIQPQPEATANPEPEPKPEPDVESEPPAIPEPPPEPKADPEPPPAPTKPASSSIGFLFGIAVSIGVGFVIWRWSSPVLPISQAVQLGANCAFAGALFLALWRMREDSRTRWQVTASITAIFWATSTVAIWLLTRRPELLRHSSTHTAALRDLKLKDAIGMAQLVTEAPISTAGKQDLIDEIAKKASARGEKSKIVKMIDDGNREVTITPTRVIVRDTRRPELLMSINRKRVKIRAYPKDITFRHEQMNIAQDAWKTVLVALDRFFTEDSEQGTKERYDSIVVIGHHDVSGGEANKDIAAGRASTIAKEIRSRYGPYVGRVTEAWHINGFFRNSITCQFISPHFLPEHSAADDASAMRHSLACWGDVDLDHKHLSAGISSNSAKDGAPFFILDKEFADDIKAPSESILRQVYQGTGEDDGLSEEEYTWYREKLRGPEQGTVQNRFSEDRIKNVRKFSRFRTVVLVGVREPSAGAR